MFLQLAHTKLDVYKFSQELALGCYQITKKFPNEEKFALVQQIRRAAIFVPLNLAKAVQEDLRLKEKYFMKYQGAR